MQLERYDLNLDAAIETLTLLTKPVPQPDHKQC